MHKPIRWAAACGLAAMGTLASARATYRIIVARAGQLTAPSAEARHQGVMHRPPAFLEWARTPSVPMPRRSAGT